MANKYSPSEYLKNIYSILMTKVFMPQARFIRRPIYVRGKKSIVGAKKLTTGRFCRFDLDGKKKTLWIGENCEMGDNTHIVALNKVEIGNNVLIASKCFISDTSHGSYKGMEQEAPEIPPRQRKLIKGEVRIGDNVWIGENVVVLSGVEIGSGSIIGANSVITKSIEANSVVVGNNRTIKKYNYKTNEWKSIDE